MENYKKLLSHLVISLGLISLSISASFAQSSKNNARYNMSDLLALQVEGSFSEFFAHARDIRPSERKERWQEILEDMGARFTQKMLSDKTIDSKDISLLKDISKWAHFENNEIFIQKRDPVFIRIISQCFQAKQTHCMDTANEIYFEYKHEYSFSFDFIKVLERENIPKSSLWSYVHKFSQNKFSEFYCHKSPLKDILAEKIIVNDWLKKPSLDIHKDCIKKIVPTLKLALESSDKEYRKSAFNVLFKNGHLKKKDFAKFYLIEYLEDEISADNKMDKALSELDFIANNSAMRDEFKNEFSKKSLLPGKLFKSNKRAEIKTRILYRHFPEYIDLYAKTCLSYLKGEKHFNKGNPTPECHDLFKIDKSLSILPKQFHKQYEKATSFAQ